MNPSFSKNLGPIKVKAIKNLIDCASFNLEETSEFNDFTCINNLKKGDLSFLNDSQFSIENRIINKIFLKI